MILLNMQQIICNRSMLAVRNAGYRFYLVNRFHNIAPRSSKLIRTLTFRGSFIQETVFQQNETLLLVKGSTFIQRSYESSDNKNENSEVEVYYGNLAPRFRAVKVLSFMSSLGGIVIQPYLLPHLESMGSTVMTVGVLGFINFFTFVTPILLHLIMKNYVVKVVHNPESDIYTATVFTFFLGKKLIPFKISDVKVPEVPGPFTTFTINGKPLFVDVNMFNDPTHYGRMMGYDKPIDLKLKSSDTS